MPILSYHMHVTNKQFSDNKKRDLIPNSQYYKINPNQSEFRVPNLMCQTKQVNIVKPNKSTKKQVIHINQQITTRIKQNSHICSEVFQDCLLVMDNSKATASPRLQVISEPQGPDSLKKRPIPIRCDQEPSNFAPISHNSMNSCCSKNSNIGPYQNAENLLI